MCKSDIVFQLFFLVFLFRSSIAYMMLVAALIAVAAVLPSWLSFFPGLTRTLQFLPLSSVAAVGLDSPAMDVMNAPGFPVYKVFPGAGNAPAILVTSQPLSDITAWQFLGKAPANMSMHQVVHSLQQQLATWTMWTPYMVALACFNDICIEENGSQTCPPLFVKEKTPFFPTKYQTTKTKIKQPFFPTHQACLLTISEDWNSHSTSWKSLQQATKGEKASCSVCCKQTTR